MEEDKGPEIVFGLVGAVGTDLESVDRVLTGALSDVNYRPSTLKLSKLMKALPVSPWRDLPESPEFERYDKAMSAGNAFRKLLNRGDALAMLAVGAIREIRQERIGDPDRPIPRQAYILRSLKHPAEATTLRDIYGASFFLVAAYCPRETRKPNLAAQLASSEYSLQTNKFAEQTERLMGRDESERDEDEFGQNVRDTFPLADVFVDASSPESTAESVNRFVQLVFGTEIHTPSRAEYGMFHAQAAALRSAALSRQVGATIATMDGDIVAVGTNEVPRAGGGLYWCEDKPDKRDFKLGYEISDKFKRRVLGDLISRLRDRGWLSEEKKRASIDSLIEEAFSAEGGATPVMKGSHLVSSIEYVRAVHAEMAAIVDAARRGVAIRGCVLFTTTFPCHDCAKHIVAAGIQRVVFIEPYPKSLAPELYLDSIALDPKPKNTSGGAETVGYVSFESFVGVAPRRYMDVFTMSERKTKSGDLTLPNKSTAVPRFATDLPPVLAILVKENQEFKRFEDQMRVQITVKTLPQKNPQPEVVQMKKPEVLGGS